MEQYRPTRAVINLDHLAHNVRELRSVLARNLFFCPMVKANAYGHGDVDVALRLQKENVKHLGVGLIEEGLLLRQSGIRTEILFFGMFDSHGARALIENQMIPVISSWDEIDCLEIALPAGSQYPVHLKFDTGMHRLGFSLKDIGKLVSHFSQSKLHVKGILTHLHSAEDAADMTGSSFEQLRLFQEVEKAFASYQPHSHTLNSAGLLNFLQHQGRVLPHGILNLQGVRPGLSIYGLAPVSSEQVKLKSVMSLRSQTVKYHFVPRGDGVSYNRTWTATQDSVIAVVPIGYADGYHRLLSNQAEVLFRNQRVPLVGNICMDYLMLDITSTLKNEIADSLKSEPVTLFGEDEMGHQISASELAIKARTITWEILTSVGERVPRISFMEGSQ